MENGEWRNRIVDEIYIGALVLSSALIAVTIVGTALMWMLNFTFWVGVND